jgi:outer membrane protein assembly factor BamB
MRLRDPGIQSDEVVFDSDGRMMLVGDGDVLRLDTGGVPDPILRGVFGPGGGAMRFMPDGSLLVASFTTSQTSRYDLTTGRELFHANTRLPNKMALAPGGRLYVSSQEGFIYLLNSTTGTGDVIATPDSGVGALAFSLDYRTLYAGLLADRSIVAFAVQTDGSLGQRRVLAGQIPNLLALAVDECGDLYAAGGTDGDVRRISPTGRIEVVARTDMPELWGMAFGSGKHGWSDTALYITGDSDGNHGLFELQVGVKGAPPPAP